MHKLLARQLRRAGVSLDDAGPAFRKLLDLVEEAYRAADDDRIMVERSLELTSQELLARNLQLEDELATRQAAQDDLRASEQRYRLLFDRSPASIILFAAESLRILAVNDAAITMYGYTREEFLGRPVTDFRAPQPNEELPDAMADPSGWASRGTTEHRKKDGTLFDVAITAHQVVLESGRAVLAMSIDLTEARRLEEQLRHAQKMDAIGQLAGGVAHDFNNIVAAILVYAELAASTLGAAHPVVADILEIEKAGRRAAGLTGQLLAFSRKQPCQPRALALSSVVTSMGQMLSRVIGEHVELSVATATRLWPIYADPTMIEQVLVNLVVNARDAMPCGGRVTIATRNAELDDASARAVGVPAGPHVVLEVADNGSGMDDATRARIFEPFFTTKALGKGTGLGLATVFGIVKQLGGGITVSSKPGAGAVFSVYLPRAHGQVDSTLSRPPSLLPPGGAETVLVVEDDEQVRRVVCRLLAASGYDVLEAESAREALEVLRERRASVRLLVTDVVMPEVDGRTLAKQALLVKPQLKVLLMSGYTPGANEPVLPSAHFMRKPFTAREVAQAVRHALDSE